MGAASWSFCGWEVVLGVQDGAWGAEWRGMPRVLGLSQTRRIDLSGSIWLIVAVLVLVTAFFEFAIMWALPRILPVGLPWWQEALIDSAILGCGLALVMSPVLILPLQRRLSVHRTQLTEGMQRIAAVEGEEFHQALVRYLAEQFETSLVLVGEVIPGEKIRSLAGWTPEGPMEPIEYAIAGTPCEVVMQGDGSFFERGVAERFPADTALTEMGAVSYVGVPMVSPSGKVLGLVAVVGTTPLKDPESALLLVRLLAARAGMELLRSRAVRRQAESRLREKALEDLLDAISIMSTTDASGRITHVNENFCKISGYSREEMLGQDHRLVNSGHHPKSLWTDLYRKAARGEVWRAEVCNRHKSGSLYWMQAASTGVLDDAGKLREIVSIRFDVTAIKNAELRNRSLAAAVEAAHDGMCVVDFDGEVILYNNAFCEQVGLTVVDCVGLQFVDVFTRPEDKNAVSEALSTRKELTRRVRIRRGSAGGDVNLLATTPEAEGDWLWVDVRLTPIVGGGADEGLCVCVQRDVSEQVREEERLRLEAEGRRAQLDIGVILGEIFLPMEDRLEGVVQRLLALEGLEVHARGGVFLPEGDGLRLAVKAGEFSAEFLEGDRHVKKGECLCGRAQELAEKGEFGVTVSDDCFCDPQHKRHYEGMTAHGHYIVPIHFGGSCEGVLFLYTEPYPKRDAARLEFLERVGEQIGSAIVSDRLREQAEQEEFERQLSEDLAALRLACQSILSMGEIPFEERAHEILDYVCTSEGLGFGNTGSLFVVEDGGMRVMAWIEGEEAAADDGAGETVLPLEYQGKHMGELVLRMEASDEYRQVRYEFLNGLAELLATALQTEQLREKAERLQQDQAGTLLAMGREMRTPMTSIVAAADMLGEDEIGMDDREELTAMVRRNAGHLMSVVDNILELAGLSSASAIDRPSTESEAEAEAMGVLRGARILLLEEREGVAALVVRELREHGAMVEVSRRAEIGMSMALGAWRAERPHSLVVMTVGAAKTDVDVVPRLLREAGYSSPIMVLCDGAEPEGAEAMLVAGCDRVVLEWTQQGVAVAEAAALLGEAKGQRAA